MNTRLIIVIVVVVAAIVAVPLVLPMLQGSKEQSAPPAQPEGARPAQEAAPSPQPAAQPGSFTPEKLGKLRNGMTVQEINSAVGISGAIAAADPNGVTFTKTPIQGQHILLKPETDFYEWRGAEGSILLVNIYRGQAVRVLLYSPNGTQRRLF